MKSPYVSIDESLRKYTVKQFPGPKKKGIEKTLVFSLNECSRNFQVQIIRLLHLKNTRRGKRKKRTGFYLSSGHQTKLNSIGIIITIRYAIYKRLKKNLNF